MKMQPFNQQKPIPFKVVHGRWGLKGHLSSPRQPPKKTILLYKQNGDVSTKKRIVSRETGIFYEKVVARLFDSSQIQSPTILHQRTP